MDVRDWRVTIIAANKLEEQIVSTVLRGAGAASIRVIRDNSTGFEALGDANILVLSENAAPLDCFELVWLLRRFPFGARKLPVFMVSDALTLALVEKCENAGANAIVGQPVSAAVILNVIRKVLSKSRPFIESEGYAGAPASQLQAA